MRKRRTAQQFDVFTPSGGTWESSPQGNPPTRFMGNLSGTLAEIVMQACPALGPNHEFF